ncbi:unnamed protein product [Prorocentrum cordatum]|uniref:Uncharacterized protein n=1 Tax=Prorocentrum cordatum TaxID=2364126 RepID=A0ABN9VQ42_9DINO|nr:unnamed protein product [Polarella glacialis]
MPATSAGGRLEAELQRITAKAIRDACSASEDEHSEEVLQLLFETPTPLHFHAVDQLMRLLQGTGDAERSDLERIVVNEPVWSRLLAKPWSEARGLRDCPLGATQRAGQQALITSAQQLQKGTIPLSALHTILGHQQAYEALASRVAKLRPGCIAESAARLRKFDEEFDQLQVYVKLFCPSAGIAAGKLDELAESVGSSYAALELQAAASKFAGLPVRPHLPWLHSLRGSDVFASIWREAARRSRQEGSELAQDVVVGAVIPAARRGVGAARGQHRGRGGEAEAPQVDR